MYFLLVPPSAQSKRNDIPSLVHVTVCSKNCAMHAHSYISSHLEQKDFIVQKSSTPQFLSFLCPRAATNHKCFLKPCNTAVSKNTVLHL